MFNTEEKIIIYKGAILVWIKSIQFILLYIFFAFLRVLIHLIQPFLNLIDYVQVSNVNQEKEINLNTLIFYINQDIYHERILQLNFTFKNQQDTFYAGYLITFFIIDKFIRTVILYFEYRANLLLIPIIMLLVVLQLEELLTYSYNKSNKNLVEAIYAQSIFINIFLIPQIIVVFVWMYFTNISSSFFYVLPCFLVLSFYLNLIWVISLDFEPKDYFGTLLIFQDLFIQGISFIGYIGMVFSCRNIDYSFFYLIIVNTILSLVMSIKFINSPLYSKGSRYETIYYFSLLFLSIFLHSGCDFRKIKQNYDCQSLKQFKVKNFNTLLILRLIQTLYILILFIISISITSPKQYVSSTISDLNPQILITFVMSFTIVSIANQIADLWVLIIQPEIKNEEICFEIDSINTLIEYNNQDMEQKINCSFIQFITFYFSKEDILTNPLYLKEFDYCLLFNFYSKVNLYIHQVGERVFPEDSDYAIVSFKRMVDIKNLENNLNFYQILPFINKIQFEQRSEISECINLIKILSNHSYNIFVTSKNMPNKIIQIQEQSFQMKFIAILHYQSYQKIISRYLPINPQHVFYELYEI